MVNILKILELEVSSEYRRNICQMQKNGSKQLQLILLTQNATRQLPKTARKQNNGELVIQTNIPKQCTQQTSFTLQHGFSVNASKQGTIMQ